MPLLGFFLLLVGFIMNIQIMRRLRRANVPAGQIVTMMPWLVSAALIGVGVLILAISAH